MQCGYPMHNYCYKKLDRKGCPGVCNNKHTLSQKGFPCFWDHSRNDCAWCSDNGYQCGPGKATGPESQDGSRCQNGRNKNYCDSVLGDCRHIPYCDPNAQCKFKREFGKDTKIFECRCNNGFKGNGIQCHDEEGNLSISPEKIVEVEMKLESEFYVFPYTNGEFSFGEKMEKLFHEMELLAGVCPVGRCQAPVNTTDENFF